MALVPVIFKLEKDEADALEREAKSVPKRTLSGYLREIVQRRRRPKEWRGKPSDNN